MTRPAVLPFLLLICTVLFFALIPGTAGGYEMDVTIHVSNVVISADQWVAEIGYTANGLPNAERLGVTDGDKVVILLNKTSSNRELRAVVRLENETEIHTGNPININISNFSTGRPVSILVNLSLADEKLSPWLDYRPSSPTGTPGVEDLFTSLLPPAGMVSSLAGLIPITLGGSTLYLLFFWKRKVYRILTHHAKRHGESPEKKLLDEISKAIIHLVRSSESYAGWRTDQNLTRLLREEIIRTLDIMNYPQTVPRDKLVAEILKSAKSKINRHRL
jgi:hypothetical protein